MEEDVVDDASAQDDDGLVNVSAWTSLMEMKIITRAAP